MKQQMGWREGIAWLGTLYFANQATEDRDRRIAAELRLACDGFERAVRDALRDVIPNAVRDAVEQWRLSLAGTPQTNTTTGGS